MFTERYCTAENLYVKFWAIKKGHHYDALFLFALK